MRLVVRRLVATSATTALLCTGAVALATSASAEGLAGVNPSATTNDGLKQFTATSGATEFHPTSDGNTTITLTRTPAVIGQGVITGTATSNTASCTQTLPGLADPDGDCGHTLQFSANLANAAPGSYALDIAQPMALPTGDDRDFTSTVVISALASPSVDSTALYTGTAVPPDGQLAITGDNLAKGSTVQFLKPSDPAKPDEGLVNDDGLTFAPTVDGGTAGNGYVSATTLRGKYTQGAYTSGVHHLKVTNTTGTQSGVETARFYQPAVAATSPSVLAIGQGASSVPFTFTGPADLTFNPTSTLFVTANGAQTAATDITVADQSVDAAQKVFSASLSATAAATTGTRSLTVRGADGGYYKLSQTLAVNAAPTITSIAPATRGQGYAGNVTITGTGFTSGSVFDFGQSITASTTSATATSATVAITVGPTAVLGARAVKVTNPDHGTSTKSSAFTVTQAPAISSVSPSSGARGDTAKAISYTGTGFAASGVTITPSGTGVTFSAPTTGSSTSMSGTYTVAADAAYGSRDLTVTNPDGGTTTCTACFGVNNLKVTTPGPFTNNATQQVTMVAEAGNPALTADTTVSAVLPGAADQGAIAGTVVSFNAGQLTVSFPFTNKGAGSYTITTTTPQGGGADPSVLSCSGCVRIVAAAAPGNLAVSPTTGGQGAVHRALTVTGTGLYPGQKVTFSGAGISTVSTTFVTDHLNVVIDIAPGATVGARDVTVANSDGTSTTKTAGFTVTAGPTVASIDPDTIGQGGTVDLTITGTGFTADSVVTLSGTHLTAGALSGTATATTITVPVTVGSDTEVGLHDVTVTNPGDGGSGTGTGALTITAAPVITSITPGTAARGTGPTNVTITGTGFQKDDTNPVSVICCGNAVTFSNLVASADGTTLTGTFTVNAAAPDGKKTLQVVNPDGGASLFGDDAGEAGFVVATPPTPPTTVLAKAGDTTALVAWSGQVAGGSPITEYTIQVADSSDSPIRTQVVTAPASSATVTGLTNLTTYHFTVKAKNASGYGAYSTSIGSATPKYAVKLTSTVSPRSSVSGARVTYSGRLTRVAGGAAVSGATVKLTLKPAVGASHTYQVPTRADGTWSYGANPVYNTTVSAVSVETANELAGTATSFAESISTKVTITSPTSGSSTPATTTLVIRGATSPNKAGQTIGLYRMFSTGYKGIASARIASNGTYAISVKLPKGSYYVKTGVGPVGGNATGYATSILVKRT